MYLFDSAKLKTLAFLRLKYIIMKRGLLIYIKYEFMIL